MADASVSKRKGFQSLSSPLKNRISSNIKGSFTSASSPALYKRNIERDGSSNLSLCINAKTHSILDTECLSSNISDDKLAQSKDKTLVYGETLQNSDHITIECENNGVITESSKLSTPLKLSTPFVPRFFAYRERCERKFIEKPRNFTGTPARRGGRKYSPPLPDEDRPPFYLAQLSKLSTTRYSTLLPYQAPQVRRVLRHFFPIEMHTCDTTILDGTAHVGGDAINFASLYPLAKITAVEIDPEAITLLEQNIENLSDPKRFTIVNCDIRKFVRFPIGGENDRPERFCDRPFDVVYLDPPWGGPTYYTNANVSLFLGDTIETPGTPIVEIINHILIQKIARRVILKAPKNFDYKLFYSQIKGETTSYQILKPQKKNVVAYYLLTIVPLFEGAERNIGAASGFSDFEAFEAFGEVPNVKSDPMDIPCESGVPKENIVRSGDLLENVDIIRPDVEIKPMLTFIGDNAIVSLSASNGSNPSDVRSNPPDNGEPATEPVKVVNPFRIPEFSFARRTLSFTGRTE